MVSLNKKLLPFDIDRSSFVLSVGDEGAILCYVKNGVLTQRLFSTLTSAPDKQAFQKLLLGDPHAPVHILLDVIDQSCSQQSLPAVSSLTINKLVKKRLDRDFTATDLRGAIPQGREKNGRHDWRFLFVSTPTASPLTDWIEFLMGFPNRISGISLLPVEALSFVKTLLKKEAESEAPATAKKARLSKIFPSKKAIPTANKANWHFITFHNKISGFRQVVFKDNQLVFTRLVQSPQDASAPLVAGALEQETINTLEYLRRLSFNDDDSIDIYIIAAQEILSVSDNKTLQGQRLLRFTPHEMAQKLGLKGATQAADRFADVLFATHFSKSRRILNLQNNLMKQYAVLHYAAVVAKIFAVSLIPFMLLYILGVAVDIWTREKNISFAESQTKKLTALHTKRLQEAPDYNEENANKISDMVVLYNLLSGASFSPLTLLSDFNTIRGPYITVKSYEWSLNTQTPSPNAIPDFTTSLSIEFSAKDSSFDDLFNNFDAFSQRLEKTFAPPYKMEYSRLPERIAFTDREKVIPIQITISGPADASLRKAEAQK